MWKKKIVRLFLKKKIFFFWWGASPPTKKHPGAGNFCLGLVEPSQKGYSVDIMQHQNKKYIFYYFIIIIFFQHPNFRWIFHDNLKNRNRRIFLSFFSFYPAHCASFWKWDKNWGDWGMLLLVGTEPKAEIGELVKSGNDFIL